MNNTENETTSPIYTETLEFTSISGTKKRRCPASDTTTVITRASVKLATTRPLAICNGNGKEEACLCVALRWPVGEDVDSAVRQASLFAFERTIEAVSSGLVSFESYKPPRMTVIAPSITTPARTSAGNLRYSDESDGADNELGLRVAIWQYNWSRRLDHCRFCRGSQGPRTQSILILFDSGG